MIYKKPPRLHKPFAKKKPRKKPKPPEDLFLDRKLFSAKSRFGKDCKYAGLGLLEAFSKAGLDFVPYFKRYSEHKKIKLSNTMLKHWSAMIEAYNAVHKPESPKSPSPITPEEQEQIDFFNNNRTDK